MGAICGLWTWGLPAEGSHPTWVWGRDCEGAAGCSGLCDGWTECGVWLGWLPFGGAAGPHSFNSIATTSRRSPSFVTPTRTQVPQSPLDAFLQHSPETVSAFNIELCINSTFTLEMVSAHEVTRSEESRRPWLCLTHYGWIQIVWTLKED